MKTPFLAVAVLAGSATLAFGQDTGAAPAAASPQSVVKEGTCLGCHNERTKRGELVLSGLDAARPAENAATWKKSFAKSARA